MQRIATAELQETKMTMTCTAKQYKYHIF